VGFFLMYSWPNPMYKTHNKLHAIEIIKIMVFGLRASNYAGSFDLLRSFF
jgi:hypothetical protein